MPLAPGSDNRAAPGPILRRPVYHAPSRGAAGATSCKD